MKIIAVDDDGISLELLNECLTGGGYEHVTLMSSPLKALKAIQNTAIAYDCILLDVEMPEKDGIQLCADIRRLERYRNTPILMITKYKDHAAVEQAFANGATDYITKPFEFFEVLARIRVAGRLIQERQAAIDSYIAVQGLAGERAARTEHSTTWQPESPANAEPLKLASEKLLSLSVFQNYLEQVTRADACKINLMAIKIRNIEQIFASTTAVEFVGFLETTAAVISDEFKPEKAFLTHMGNGIFMCAVRGVYDHASTATEAAILRRLAKQKLPRVCQNEILMEIIIGNPLTLTTTPKLNFKRAVKAATARVDMRDADLRELSLNALSG